MIFVYNLGTYVRLVNKSGIHVYTRGSITRVSFQHKSNPRLRFSATLIHIFALLHTIYCLQFTKVFQTPIYIHSSTKQNCYHLISLLSSMPVFANCQFISHKKSDLNQGLNHTKTGFDQTRFKPWFFPLKLRSRPDMKT